MVLRRWIHSLLYTSAVTLLFTFKKCLDILVPGFLDHPEYSRYILFHIVPLCLRLLNVALNGVEKFGHLWIGSFIVHVSGGHEALAVSDFILQWNIFIRLVFTFSS